MYWLEESDSPLSFSFGTSRSEPGRAVTTEHQQKFQGTATSAPGLDVITSCPELQWLLQPSLPSYPSCLRGSYSSYLPPSGPNYPMIAGERLMRSAGEQNFTEEGERRRLRREKNKIAAAKCRNRRRELTDALEQETQELEQQQAWLQEEVAGLQKDKDSLVLALEAHQPVCKMSQP